MIERLSADSAPVLARLGGKGCGLVRLLRAGFPVPEVWCLPADFEPAADQLEALLAELAATHPGWSFAVRSSATAEDLAEASFAGVYTTVLGARSAAELVRAVQDCRASLRTPQAQAYRAARGIGEDVRMAVLIQRLLDPELAGVMLTANPQRAFANELVIDAAFGLGEGVVSGRTDPDHFVLDRQSGALRERRIGEKKLALRRGAGAGLVEVAVTDELRSRACLDAAALGRLFALARSLGEALGPRLDLEWAIAEGSLYLLQARPISGLPPENPEEVWSRRFGDEYMADYTTPSGYTFLVRWIREYTFSDSARQLGRTDLLAMEPLCRYNGYVYLSGRYVIASMRALPPGSREDALRGWFPPRVSALALAEPFSPRLLVKSLLLPWRDPRGPMAKNLLALEAHAARVMRELAPRRASDYGVLSDDLLTARLEQLDEIGYDHFRVIRWGMGQYAPALHGALQRLLARWAGDHDGALYQALVSGLPETHTVRINRDLWQLALLARGDAALLRSLREGVSAEALRERHGELQVFWSGFDDFIARHGHRSTTRDVSQPRWREAPGLVLSLLRAQLVGDSAPENPETFEAAARQRRREAEVRTLAALGRGPLAALRRRVLRWLARRAQDFTVFRENQRYYLDVILAQLRLLLLEHARRLARAGLLDDPWQIFLLEADELHALWRGRRADPEQGARLRQRFEHYAAWRQRLPATFLFDGVETEGEVVEGDPAPAAAGAAEASAACGLGAARGRSRGRLRVLRDIDSLDQLERGEILVAGNIDPGWTSVFPLLAGLVTETGGLLSHGALLAREYGIPAVMGVRDATRRFETGAFATIDGAAGTIELECEPTQDATEARSLGGHACL